VEGYTSSLKAQPSLPARVAGADEWVALGAKGWGILGGGGGRSLVLKGLTAATVLGVGKGVPGLCCFSEPEFSMGQSGDMKQILLLGSWSTFSPCVQVGGGGVFCRPR